LRAGFLAFRDRLCLKKRFLVVVFTQDHAMAHFRFWLGGAGGENKLKESLGRSRFAPLGLLQAV
jgi:hypothetical protein